LSNDLVYEKIASQFTYSNLKLDWKSSNLYTLGRWTLWPEQTEALENAVKFLYYFYEYVYPFDSRKEENDEKPNKERKKKVFSALKSNPIFAKVGIVKQNDEMFDEMTNYFEENSGTISFENFLNKMGFWMATGSGKTLVLVKLIQILDELMRKEKIPNNEILVLTENEKLLEQISNTVKEYNQGSGKKIIIRNLKDDFQPKKKSDKDIIIYTYLSGRISTETKEVEYDYKDFESNGRWYVFLDEAHKGSGIEDKKRAKFFSIISRNGFLFNFSATFTEEEDKLTTVYNFNLEKFTNAGYGKNLYLYEQVHGIQKKSSEKNKKSIVLQILLNLVLLQKIKAEISKKTKENVYHKPMLIVFTGSVSKTDSDLQIFFEQIREIAKGKLKSKEFNDAKKALEKELDSKIEFCFQSKEIEFTNEIKKILKNIEKEDVLNGIFNSNQGKKGEFEYSIVNEEDEPEILLTHKNSGIDPFAIINIGEDGVDGWKKKLDSLGIKNVAPVDKESRFDRIDDVDSTVNIVMASRKIYEGWDTVRPNLLVFVGIGTGNAQKYVLQSIGRGIRIQPFVKESGRKRMLEYLGSGESLQVKADQVINKDKVEKEFAQYLETFFISGTNQKNVTAILDTVQTQTNTKKSISLEKTDGNKTLLVPKYKNKGQVKVNLLPMFDGEKIKIEKYLKWLKEDSVIIANFSHVGGFDRKMLKRVRDFITNGNFSGISDFEIEEQVERLIKFVQQDTWNFEKFENITDEIKHFEDIRLQDDEKTNDEIETKVEKVKEFSTLPTIDEAMEQQNMKKISKEEFKELMKKITNTSKSEDVGELKIENIEGHYFNPIIYGDGTKKTKISPIIAEESEHDFIKELLKSIENDNSKLKEFDWWMFSRIQQNTDKIYIPYYDSQKNKTQNYYPDFIFWLVKDNNYYIIFIDPKGIQNTGSIRKAEGHEGIFGSNSKSKEIQADGKYTVIVKNWFFVKDKNEVPKELQKYWKDDFEEILKDALNSKK